ncbi:two-component system sensor histidine kinase NtrB [Entomobacter blattae]|uniref:histidine kinase n=1 Tax=Entomobacter blattae TaxID=2762277 RepID=A0A7H1NPF6_9PROT|nr:ATP-binding protein [Entomobacter blattae]QNT77666.1 Histidine kinase-, DNA gyrase B-, and HSP90-like ATPase [Entomobacter blattae]
MPPAKTLSMKEQIRAKDWSVTPLGARETWPPLLVSTLNLILASSLPMAIRWGKEHILLYNDTYAQFSASRHPDILGLPGAEAWPELASLQKYIDEEIHAQKPVVISNQCFRNVEHPSEAPRNDLWVDIHYSPIEDSKGYVKGILVVIANPITPETETTHRNTTTKAIEQIIGGLAHDFNNILSGITGNLELMGLRVAQKRYDTLPHYIAEAHNAANRAAAITNHLLSFSRQQTLMPRPLNLNETVLGLAHKLQTLYPSTPECMIHIKTELLATGEVFCDPQKLESALLNICENAYDAMPKGGTLTFKTKNCVINQEQASAYTSINIAPGYYAVLYIIDTGEGMSAHTLARAFDPFFTMRPLGHGSGLGLSMSYGFVRQSEGYINLASAEGHGTTIRIMLPMAKK